MRQQMPLFNQVMFAIPNVLLNNLALFHTLSSHIIHTHVNTYPYKTPIYSHMNTVQPYHPYSREYTDMQPFAMHYFQGCRGSLKS